VSHVVTFVPAATLSSMTDVAKLLRIICVRHAINHILWTSPWIDFRMEAKAIPFGSVSAYWYHYVVYQYHNTMGTLV